MVLVCTAVSASSAATPSWYFQLHLAVVDAGDAGAAFGTCKVPHAATPKAGRQCEIARASLDSGVLVRVSVYAEAGSLVGPCKRLLLQLDNMTTDAAQTAFVLATRPTTTIAQDASARRALERIATHVAGEFAAVQHCLGIAKS
jgi:hypothetical protein